MLTLQMLQKYKLIDTAGIRRRAAVASAGSTTETLSVKRAFSAIRRSDVVALVIEAMSCVTEQVFISQSIHMCTQTIHIDMKLVLTQ
jgi:predicted GTPase